MTPYCGYAIYDVERTRTRVEQLEIDALAGRCGAALWRSLTDPVHRLRRTANRPSRSNVEQRLDLARRESGGMRTPAGLWRVPR
jgi:hypothetical protein